MKENALKYVLEQANERVTEFYNLNELPELPPLSEYLEEIVLNMPVGEVTEEEHFSIINAAAALMLKKSLDVIASQDDSAIRAAFNALSTNNINQEKVQEMEELLNGCETLELPGDEDEEN